MERRYGYGVTLVIIGGFFLSTSGILLRNIESASGWQILFYRGVAFSLTLFLLLLLRYRGGIGNAFRTGTHKAMIFSWLQIEGRETERTKVYGHTRSWSKLGSALSVVLAAIFVFMTDNYIYIFFLSILPYLLGIINIMGYPSEVDGPIGTSTSPREVIQHLRDAMSTVCARKPLRRLLFESMGFEGFFGVAKDYLQPILKATALPLTAALLLSDALSEHQRVALLVGPVYLVLYLLSALASRKAHVLVDRHESEEHTARSLWLILLATVIILMPALYYGWLPVVITGFIAMYILQNLWRPLLVSRIADHSDAAMGATILSVESQAKGLASVIIAPALGYLVDMMAAKSIGALPFWPVGIFGLVIALTFIATAKPAPRGNDQ